MRDGGVGACDLFHGYRKVWAGATACGHSLGTTERGVWGNRMELPPVVCIETRE